MKFFFKLIKKEWIFILLLVFYLGAVLFHFGQQGLVNWDESYFAIVIRTFSDLFKTALFHPADLFSSGYFSKLQENYGNVYTIAKPSYLLTASFLAMFWPSELAIRLLSVLSGVGVLIIFYRLLGLYGFNKKIKISTVFLLAASPLFLIFSRIGLAPMFTSFFMLLALEQLLRYKKNSLLKNFIISGLALSAMLMSHYSTFIIAGVVLLFALFYLYRKKQKLKTYLLYAGSFLSPIFLWEAITRLGAFIAARQGIVSDDGRFGAWPYSLEFINQLKINSGNGHSFTIEQADYYFRLLWSMEGAIIFFLILLGIIIFLKHWKKPEYNLIAATGGIFFLILSAAHMKFPRTLMPIFPLFYILIAAVLAFFSEKFKKNPGAIIITVICLLTLTFHAENYNRILNIQTPFKIFAALIEKNYSTENTLILSANPPLWRSYLPGYKVERVNEPSAWEQYIKDRKILVTEDYFNWITLPDHPELNYATRKIVAEAETNIFQVNPIIEDLAYDKKEEIKKLNKENKKILLYEITLTENYENL